MTYTSCTLQPPPRFRLRLYAATVLAVVSTAASAQSPPPADDTTSQTVTSPPVTVTASKRDQSLDSINGAVVVVEQSAVEGAQITNTLELARVLPGVQMSSSGSLLFPIISVRGITSAQDFYNPALTVYVDGIPQLPVFASQTLLGVERVELLKGPQGTLYGKSAEGGVLNIVTRQPDNEPRLHLRGGIASRDGYLAQGEAAGPLIKDLLYGSVSLAAVSTPGDLTNPVTGDDHQGGVRSGAGSARLRLAPAGAPWEMGVALARDCARASQDAYVPYDDIDNRTAYILPGMPEAFADFRQRRCGNSQTLSGRYDFGQWRLTMVAAWQDVDIEREFPIGPYFSRQPEDWQQNVQELRLATHAPGRRWDAVFGLYHQDVDQSRTYINDLKVPLAINALTTASSNESRSLAAYGDVTWHATTALDLSAGLRVSRDKAQTQFAGSALDFMTFMPVAFSGSGKTDGDNVLGRLSAGYRIDPSWRVYANVAQGYKPGGFNLAPSSAVDAQAFDEERSVSYEIGARFERESVRGALALYRIDVTDAQLYSRDVTAYQHLSNVGDTRSTGVEFSGEWDVTRHWTLGVSGFVNDASFRSYDDDLGCADCSGNDVPFAPRYGLTLSVKGNIPTRAGSLRPQIAIRRVGAHYFDIANMLEQDAYTLVDAALAWQVHHRVEVALYAHNLTDRDYRTYGFSGGPLGDFAQVAPGRTLGLTLAYDY